MRRRKFSDNIYLMDLLLIGLSMILLSFSFRSCANNDKTTNDYNGVKWTGIQQATIPTEQKYIAVSGITDLVFTSNNIKQYVNIVNPKENDCLMDVKIVLQDNNILWQTENIRPDYGIYEINLNYVLSKGEYPAYVIFEYKTLDNKTKLNNATFKTKITVKD